MKTITTIFWTVLLTTSFMYSSHYCYDIKTKDNATGITYIHEFKKINCNCTCEGQRTSTNRCPSCGHRIIINN